MAAGALSVLGQSACTSLYGNPHEAEMQQREDVLLLQEDINRLKGQIEGIELELERLRRDVDTVRSDQPRATEAALQSVQASLASMDSRIRAVDAARERDKKEIVDNLSGKISQIVSSSSGSRPRSGASSAPKRKVSDEGYEHVVAPGETLSAIAQAYNVRSADIIDANGLENPNALRVGQKLFIPAP
jgi:nucleoid-associated protein YgaU